MKYKFNIFYFILGFAFILGAGYLIRKSMEGFSQSPGTLVQLVSSHVPTQEDVEYYTKEYPKVVRKEMKDMTEL
uniref:Uncharacterized protein n=1 Tax=viral metagenome TaxID=1070528 RepID=A0A6C0D8J7_9ZZZZ